MSQVLFNLQSKDYEHPFDKAALEAMRSVPLFEKAMNIFLQWTNTQWQIVGHCGSSFHVTEKSCPELYKTVREVADTLEISRLPEIYTEWTYGINAFTTGHKDNTLLVLHSGAVDLLPDAELKYVIGHEMGHIKSGHVMYHVMAQSISTILQKAGIIGSVATPIQMAMGYWNRMSEFTADRAGMLACQDLDAALSAIMKMAGLPQKYFDTSNPRVFAEQAQEFLTRYGDTANKIIKNISILDDYHPWTVMRAAELIKWVESGDYDRILDEHKGKLCIYNDCGKQIDNSADICPFCGRPQN